MNMNFEDVLILVVVFFMGMLFDRYLRVPVRIRRRGNKRIKRKLYRVSNICLLCGLKKEFDDMQVDHKIPLSRGGKDAESNMQLLCGKCNSVKGNRSWEWACERMTWESSKIKARRKLLESHERVEKSF